MNNIHISKPPPAKPQGRRDRGGRRRSRTDRIPSITGTPQSLLLANGKLLHKHEGTLRIRPGNTLGRTLLPSQLWDRAHVVLDRGVICVKPLKSEEPDPSGSVILNKAKQQLKEGNLSAGIELHSIADIEQIQYKKRGDKVFKVRVRVPVDQSGEDEPEQPHDERGDRSSRRRAATLGASTAAAYGRSLQRRSRGSGFGPNVVTLALRASSSEEAEDWIKKILREILSNAIMVEQMAEVLSRNQTNADACEALFHRATSLWSLALGPVNNRLARIMTKHANWLRTQGHDADADGISAAAALMQTGDPSEPGGSFSAVHTTAFRTKSPLNALRELVHLQYLAEESERQARKVTEESHRSRVLNEVAIGDQQRLAQEAKMNAQRALQAEKELRQVQEHARKLEEDIKREREFAQSGQQMTSDESSLSSLNNVEGSISKSEKELKKLLTRRDTLVRTISIEGSRAQQKHMSLSSMLDNIPSSEDATYDPEEPEFIHMNEGNQDTYDEHLENDLDEAHSQVSLDDGSPAPIVGEANGPPSTSDEETLPKTRSPSDTSPQLRKKSSAIANISSGLTRIGNSFSTRMSRKTTATPPSRPVSMIHGNSESDRSIKSLTSKFPSSLSLRLSKTFSRTISVAKLETQSSTSSLESTISAPIQLAAESIVPELDESTVMAPEPTPEAEIGEQSTKGCYLVFSSNDQGSLHIHWSETIVDGALAFFEATKRVPSFKYRQNAGRSPLISGFLGGQGRRRYYNGWVQYIKLSRDFRAKLTIFDAKGCEFFYLDNNFHVHSILPNRPLDVKVIEAICVIPPKTEVYGGVQTMTMDLFTGQGNQLGAAALTANK